MVRVGGWRELYRMSRENGVNWGLRFRGRKSEEFFSSFFSCE